MIHYLNDSCTDEWLREMLTIEGDMDIDALEFVSGLKPRIETKEEEEQ